MATSSSHFSTIASHVNTPKPRCNYHNTKGTRRSWRRLFPRLLQPGVLVALLGNSRRDVQHLACGGLIAHRPALPPKNPVLTLVFWMAKTGCRGNLLLLRKPYPCYYHQYCACHRFHQHYHSKCYSKLCRKPYPFARITASQVCPQQWL